MRTLLLGTLLMALAALIAAPTAVASCHPSCAPHIHATIPLVLVGVTFLAAFVAVVVGIARRA